MKGITWFVLFLLYAFVSGSKSAVPSLSPAREDFKQSLDIIWRAINKNIKLFQVVNQARLCSFLLRLFLVKELISSNTVLLTQSLDAMPTYYMDLFGLCLSDFGMVPTTNLGLQELDFVPNLEYVKMLTVNQVSVENAAKRIPEFFANIALSLCAVQYKALNLLAREVNSGNLAGASETKELATTLNYLIDYSNFFSYFNKVEPDLSKFLTTLMQDCVKLRTIKIKGLTLESFKSLKFQRDDIIPLFLAGFKPAENYFTSAIGVNLISHDLRLEYYVKVNGLSTLAAQKKYLFSKTDMIDPFALIPTVFPTINEIIVRAIEVIKSLEEIIIENKFSDQAWPFLKSFSAVVPFCLKVLTNPKDKGLAASYLSSVVGSAIGCCVNSVVKNSKFQLDPGNVQDVTLESAHIRLRMSVKIDLQQIIIPKCPTRPDLANWMPSMLELEALLSYAAIQYIESSNIPVIIDRELILAYITFDVKAKSKELRKLKGEEFLKWATSFAGRELDKIGLFNKSTKIETQKKDLDELVAHINGPDKVVEKKRKSPKEKMVTIKLVTDDAWDVSDETMSEGSIDLEKPTEIDDPESSEEEQVPSSENILYKYLKPSQVYALIDYEDFALMEEHDPRDIAYGYMVLGNAIFYRYIAPLIRALEKAGVCIYSAFRASIQKFEHEIKLLALLELETLQAALHEANIPNIFFFHKCLKLYGKRLSVAHQEVPTELPMKKSVAKLHLAMLCNSAHDKFGSGLEVFSPYQSLFKFFTLEAEPCPMTPFKNRESRSGFLPSEDAVQFELSILGLTSIFKEFRVGNTRNEIAHARPSPKTISVIINEVFRNSPDYEFLLGCDL